MSHAQVRFPKFSVAAGACLWALLACSTAAFADEADGRLDRVVESKLRGGPNDWFVLGLGVTTFHKSVERFHPAGVICLPGEHPGLLVTREFRISAWPQHPVSVFEFRLCEGRTAARQAVVDHLLKYQSAEQLLSPPRRRGAVDPNPGPVGEWKQLGHFTRPALADRGLQAAVNSYNTTPRWISAGD